MLFSELVIWNWMRQVNCHSVSAAVELMSKQAFLKEMNQESSQEHQESSVAYTYPTAPRGMEERNVNASSHQSTHSLRAASCASISIFSDISEQQPQESQIASFTAESDCDPGIQ